MELGQCPYCNMLGLITTIKSTPGGFEVTAQCRECGYGSDSEYVGDRADDDLPHEFDLPMEYAARD